MIGERQVSDFECRKIDKELVSSTSSILLVSVNFNSVYNGFNQSVCVIGPDDAKVCC